MLFPREGSSEIAKRKGGSAFTAKKNQKRGRKSTPEKAIPRPRAVKKRYSFVQKGVGDLRKRYVLITLREESTGAEKSLPKT